MTDRDVDVLVVGAGPTGLVAALWLRRLGVDVLCIDKLAEPSQRPKGNCVQTRTIEMMSILDLSEPLIAQGQFATHSTSYFDGEQIFSRTFLDLLTDSEFGGVLWTSQADIERTMTTALLAAGGHIERQVELVGIDVSSDSVVVSVESSDARQSVRARWVIAADGSHSKVRELLGVARDGRDFPQRWVMATVMLDPPMLPDQESTFYAHGYPALYVDPGPGGWVRLVTMSLDPNFDPATATRDWFEELLVAVGAPNRIKRCAHVGSYFVHEHLAQRFRVGNVFLAGDAAHEVTPLAGQGMNCGIQDGINIAWKIAMVHSGVAHESLIDTYESERMIAARQADELSESLTDWAIAVMTKSMAAQDSAEVVGKLRADLADMDYSQEAQVMLRYPSSVISHDWLTATPTPGQLFAGERVPTNLPARRADGTVGCVTDVLSERYFVTLVVDPAGSESDTSARVRATLDSSLKGASVVMHLVTESAENSSSNVAHDFTLLVPDEVLKVLTGGVAAMVVIRPDGYVAARIPLSDCDSLLSQFLDRLTMP